LESQVDVLLKMEEERLVLLKDHKESQEKISKLSAENLKLESEC